MTPPSSVQARRRASTGNHCPRPSSVCMDTFKKQKLRYAEGLKRHFVDANETDQDDCQSSGASLSKKRHISASDSEGRAFDVVPLNGKHQSPAKRSKQRSCSKCCVTFSSVADFLKHSRLHTAPYKCPLCSEICQDLSNMKAHVNAVHV